MKRAALLSVIALLLWCATLGHAMNNPKCWPTAYDNNGACGMIVMMPVLFPAYWAYVAFGGHR